MLLETAPETILPMMDRYHRHHFNALGLYMGSTVIIDFPEKTIYLNSEDNTISCGGVTVDLHDDTNEIYAVLMNNLKSNVPDFHFEG